MPLTLSRAPFLDTLGPVERLSIALSNRVDQACELCVSPRRERKFQHERYATPAKTRQSIRRKFRRRFDSPSAEIVTLGRAVFDTGA